MKIEPVIAIDVGAVYKVLGGEKEGGTSGDALAQATQITAEGRGYFALAVLRGEFTEAGDLIRVTTKLFDAKRDADSGGPYRPIPNTAENQAILADALNPAQRALERDLDALIAKAAAYCRKNSQRSDEMSGLRLVQPEPF